MSGVFENLRFGNLHSFEIKTPCEQHSKLLLYDIPLYWLVHDGILWNPYNRILLIIPI